MTTALHDRARRARQRIALRAWEYRQRDHARGVWARLRRILADAERAFAASDEQAQELLAEGHRVEPVGVEMHPPKTILFAPAERVSALGPLRELELRLGPDVLSARCLLLVPFPQARSARCPR
jgi:hypothetical protein